MSRFAVGYGSAFALNISSPSGSSGLYRHGYFVATSLLANDSVMMTSASIKAKPLTWR